MLFVSYISIKLEKKTKQKKRKKTLSSGCIEEMEKKEENGDPERFRWKL